MAGNVLIARLPQEVSGWPPVVPVLSEDVEGIDIAEVVAILSLE